MKPEKEPELQEKISLRVDPSDSDIIKTSLSSLTVLPASETVTEPEYSVPAVGEAFISHAQSGQEAFSAMVDSALATSCLRKVDPVTILYAPSRLLVPEAERQYTFQSPLSKDIVLQRLALLDVPDQKENLVVKIHQDHFSALPGAKANLFQISKFFMPRFEGVVLINSNGQTVLTVKSSLSSFVSDLINCPPLAIVLVFLSYFVSSYLLPHPILLFSSLVLATAVPVLLSLLATVTTRLTYPAQLRKILATIAAVTESSQICAAEVETSIQSKPQLLLRFRADVFCAALYLLLAFGLHAGAWQYWCAGQYSQCLVLCAPVKTLAQAVLGNNSATVGDCNYYLAECYRCLGQLKQAQKLYGEAAQAMLPALGKKNPFYADVLYNQGRVEEELGNYTDAETSLSAALQIWKSAPEVGEQNIFYAKGLNRLAMLSLKMHKLNDAELFQRAALKIDKSYGQSAFVEESENDLAAIEINLGHTAEASLLLEQAVNYQPREKIKLVPIFINLSQLYVIEKNPNKARQFYQMAAAVLSAKTTAANFEVSEESLRQLSKIYKKSLQRIKADYEVPNFATRGNTTFSGEGQI